MVGKLGYGDVSVVTGSLHEPDKNMLKQSVPMDSCIPPVGGNPDRTIARPQGMNRRSVAGEESGKNAVPTENCRMAEYTALWSEINSFNRPTSTPEEKKKHVDALISLVQMHCQGLPADAIAAHTEVHAVELLRQAVQLGDDDFGTANYLLGKFIVQAFARSQINETQLLVAEAFFKEAKSKNHPGSIIYLQFLELRKKTRIDVGEALKKFIKDEKCDEVRVQFKYYLAKLKNNGLLGEAEKTTAEADFEDIEPRFSENGYRKGKINFYLGVIKFEKGDFSEAKECFMRAISFGAGKLAGIWQRLLKLKALGLEIKIVEKDLTRRELGDSVAAFGGRFRSLTAEPNELSEDEVFFNNAEVIEVSFLGGYGQLLSEMGVFKLVFQHPDTAEKRNLIIKMYYHEVTETGDIFRSNLGTRELERVYLNELKKTERERSFKIADIIYLNETAINKIDAFLDDPSHQPLIKHEKPTPIKIKPGQSECDVLKERTRHRSKESSHRLPLLLPIDNNKRGLLAKEFYIRDKNTFGGRRIAPTHVIAREFMEGKHLKKAADIIKVPAATFKILGEAHAFHLIYGNTDHLENVNHQNMFFSDDWEEVAMVDNNIILTDLYTGRYNGQFDIDLDERFEGGIDEIVECPQSDKFCQFLKLTNMQFKSLMLSYISDNEKIFANFVRQPSKTNPTDLFAELNKIVNPNERKEKVDAFIAGFNRGLQIISESYGEQTLNIKEVKPHYDGYTTGVVTVVRNRIRILHELLTENNSHTT